MTDDRVVAYIDLKDDRVHTARDCPTLWPTSKLQTWRRVSRFAESIGPYERCSFCFPEYIEPSDLGEPKTPGRYPCPACGVTLADHRLSADVIMWKCLNCGRRYAPDEIRRAS